MKYKIFLASHSIECIQLFQLRLSPEQSEKVEYERERLLGFANKWMNLLAIPSSLSRSYSTFPLCSGDNPNWNSCVHELGVRTRQLDSVAQLVIAPFAWGLGQNFPSAPYDMIVIMLILLTPHWGFSVANYIEYYVYLYYLLSLDYLFLQQSWYFFPNYVYPNVPCQLSLWEETGATGENPRLSAERWHAYPFHTHTWVHSENRTHDLRGEWR
jgi:hypothetical protein